MNTNSNQDSIQKKGITLEKFNLQLERFKIGFPFLQLAAAASVDKGILVVAPQQEQYYLDQWEAYKTSPKHRVVKFVPASGAASRMFKDLFEFMGASYDEPTTKFEKIFFEQLVNFAFFKDLDKACLSNEGKNIVKLTAEGKYKLIIENLLLPKGLNYGSLPKGLLKFHKYDALERTPAEEHLMEGFLYANSNNVIYLHFTVSPEHRSLFENLISERKPLFEKELGAKFNVSFSEQKSSTDTIAVDSNNEPFMDNGELLFRPGGHGALIENLNDLDADVVFVKNIDNTVPDKQKTTEVKYKKILAGVLVDVQHKIFDYLEILNAGRYSHNELIDILYFLQESLNIKNPNTKYLEDSELVIYLKSKLNRPCRVCGMVRNVGEPGGGPFLAYNQDGTISPQILESSQIDIADPEKKEMFEKGTHFNPVDLVCGIKDYRGHSFNLLDFVDSDTGFISIKSKGGKELKALELPGLWNGAMSDWNTIFVEVPIETFNPVKTVNDLLRDAHV